MKRITTISLSATNDLIKFVSVTIHRKNETSHTCEIYNHITPASIARLRRAQDKMAGKTETLTDKPQGYRPPTSLELTTNGHTYVAMFTRVRRFTTCVILRKQLGRPGNEFDNGTVGVSRCHPMDTQSALIGDRIAFRRAVGVEWGSYYGTWGQDIRNLWNQFRRWQRYGDPNAETAG